MKKDILKSQFGEDFRAIFDKIIPDWKEDDIFKELFHKLGVCALENADKYYLLGKSQNAEKKQENGQNFDNFITDIIGKIQNDKRRSKKVPDFALKNEIWSYLFKELNKSIDKLKIDSKIKESESINHDAYEVIN